MDYFFQSKNRVAEWITKISSNMLSKREHYTGTNRLKVKRWKEIMKESKNAILTPDKIDFQSKLLLKGLLI